jgi:hypothetical protein
MIVSRQSALPARLAIAGSCIGNQAFCKVSNVTNSVDVLPQGENAGLSAGRPRRGAYTARRGHGRSVEKKHRESFDRAQFRTDLDSPPSVSERKDRLMEELSSTRVDASFGVGSGLILGGVLWVVGYLVFKLVSAFF